MAAARGNAFIRGVAGLFSFVDILNRRAFARSPAEADAEALRSAWEDVGGYLYDAMGVYSEETGIYIDRNGDAWTLKRASKEITSS